MPCDLDLLPMTVKFDYDPRSVLYTMQTHIHTCRQTDRQGQNNASQYLATASGGGGGATNQHLLFVSICMLGATDFA